MVQNAAATFLVTISHEPEGAVAIAVTDMGGTTSRPHLRHPDQDATGGRGLALVSACAADVRGSGGASGRTVTAEPGTP